MNEPKRNQVPGIATSLLLSLAALSSAQESLRSGASAAQSKAAVENRPELYNLPIDELLDLKVVTPSRVPEPLRRSPTSISVITAQDIRRMGARSLSDVLRTVPGVGLTSGDTGRSVLSVRGIRKQTTDHILVQLDGHILNDTGASSAVFFNMWSLPLHNVKRIEVVRGPASALYGANAFIAVINVITKDAHDVDGVEVALSHELEADGPVGHEYNVLFGRELAKNLEWTFNLNVLDVSGPELSVEADRVGRSGLADASRDRVDLQTGLRLGRLRLAARYLDSTLGGFFGLLSVLSPETENRTQYGHVELIAPFDVGDNAEVSLTTYFDHVVLENHLVLFPAGSIPPGHPMSPFNSTGLLDDLRHKNTKFGTQLQGVFTGFPAHTLVVGLNAELQSQHGVRRVSNNDGRGVPLAVPRDVSATFNFNQNAERDVVAAYVEDIWSLTEKLRLTSSVRYDRFSDFGDSLSPHLGLTWDFAPKLDLKLVYGTAFHAPGFGQMFLINNPFAVGNPELDAERIRTFEVGLGATPTDWFHSRVTFFSNDLDDLVAFVPRTGRLDNIQQATSNGVETEVRLQFKNGFHLALNHTYADLSFHDRGELSQVPKHRGNFIADLPIRKNFNFNFHLYWQEHTRRGAGDLRGHLPGYALLNTTLVAAELWPGLDLRISMLNILDEDYAYPASVDQIPGDFTAPGRSLVLGLKHRF